MTAFRRLTAAVRGPDPREPVHRAVWFATVALGALLVLWSVAVPAYRAPDEPQHLSTTLRVTDGGGYPKPGHAKLAHEVAASYPFADFPGGDYRTFVPIRKVTHPNGHWPSFDTLAGAPAPVNQVDQIDQMTQHPPLWAYFTAGEIELFHLKDIPAGLAIVLLRLLQGLWLMPVPWLCWRTARLLGVRERAAAAVSFLPLVAPQFLHIGASVTNGDLQVLQFAAVTPLLVKVALGDRTRRTAVLLGLLTGSTLLVKAFGLLLLPVIAFAYAGQLRGGGRAGIRERLRPVLRPCAWALGLALGIGGWWYVAQYVHTGAVQPSGYPPQILKLFRGHVGASHARAIIWQMLARTLWFDPGWFEAHSHMRLVLPILGVVSIAVLWAVVRGRADRWAATTVLLPLLLLVPLIMVEAWSSWESLHAVYGTQGRYLFPAVAGVAGVLGPALDAPRRSGVRRLIGGAAPVGVAVSQVLGLNLAIQHFWTHRNGSGLHTALVASPFSGWWWVAAAVVAVAALLAAVRALAAREPGALPPHRTDEDELLPPAPDSPDADARPEPAAAREGVAVP